MSKTWAKYPEISEYNPWDTIHEINASNSAPGLCSEISGINCMLYGLSHANPGIL